MFNSFYISINIDCHILLLKTHVVREIEFITIKLRFTVLCFHPLL